MNKEEQRWIPISDGLPKVTDRYYVTFETYSGGYMVREMFYRKPENYWTDINDILSNDEIIAWMPIKMPEPYKEEEVEE